MIDPNEKRNLNWWVLGNLQNRHLAITCTEEKKPPRANNLTGPFSYNDASKLVSNFWAGVKGDMSRLHEGVPTIAV